MNTIKQIELEQLRMDLPDFEPGDNVRVHVRIHEGEKERTQVFQGIVIARKRGTVNASFTVRKVSYGIGVERIFPTNSPSIHKIEIVEKGRVRQSKIFYIRGLKEKAVRMKLRRK